MADSCIISKEQLSQKELFLKSKLYGAGASIGPGAAPLLQATGHQTLQSNPRFGGSAQNLPKWKQPKLYQEKTLTQSPQRVTEHHRTQLAEVTDNKMNTFLDEMRQNFLQSQSAQVVPHSILYQQNRTLEKHTELLAQSQNTIAEVINNVMNQGATGINSAQALKQQIFSDNQRMILDIIAPISQQLTEVKLLHENSKSYSSEMASKIDELKRALVMQQTMGSSLNYSAATVNPYHQHDMIDPRVMMKGIEDAKEQMREMHREAMLIENDLQQRQHAMTQKAMQQRYLPQSITEEFSDYKNQLQEKSMNELINNFSTVNQTKQAVLAKLGGYFDYPLYLEELRLILSEKDQIEREFRASALVAPEFSDKAFKKVPAYDFSSDSIFGRDPFSEKQEKGRDFFHRVAQPGGKEGERPQYLNEIINSQQSSEPKVMFDYETFKEQYQTQIVAQLQPITKKTITEYQPKSSQPYGGATSTSQQPARQTWNQKAVNDNVQKRQASNPYSKSKAYGSKCLGDMSSPASSKKSGGSQNSSASNSAKKKNNSALGGKPKQDVKKMDLLSLKKQVIEEIKNEFDLNKQQKQVPNLEEFKPSLDNIIRPETRPGVNISGSKPSQISQVISQEADKQSQILAQIKSQQDNQLNQDLRGSTTSISQQQPSVSQSLLENAFADLLMSELKKVSSDSNAAQDEEVKKIGEDLILHKLNNIFDELQVEQQSKQQQQQQMYQPPPPQPIAQPQPQLYQQPFAIPQPQVQVVEQAPPQQPVVIPIVINQSNNQTSAQIPEGFNSAAATHELLKDQNKLRDMLSQVISAQLSMHNIRKDNGEKGAGDGEEMQDILGEKKTQARGGPLRDSMMSQDPLNATSRTLQEEEQKLRAEQAELRKQTFINVQPYIQQTLSMGYQNPFAFSSMPALNLTRAQNGFTGVGGLPQPLLNDLDQFNLTSDSSDFLSIDSSKYSDRKNYVSAQIGRTQGHRNRSRSNKGDRYSTLMSQDGDRSEGEVGALNSDLEDTISIGEIRYPSHAPTGYSKKSQVEPGQRKGPVMGTSAFGQRTAGRTNQALLSSKEEAMRKLGETINYEEDKELSPEKDDERPILDSSDGPILKPKARFAPNNNNTTQAQQKPVAKMGGNVMVAESFGINPYQANQLQGSKPASFGGAPQNSFGAKNTPAPLAQSKAGGLGGVNRVKIEEDFLQEDDYESDFGSVKDSVRESGEINPRWN